MGPRLGILLNNGWTPNLAQANGRRGRFLGSLATSGRLIAL
jgi:hypothetical protein